MECRSCLDDFSGLIVADTSVAINLQASQFAHPVLAAVPNRFAIPHEMERELRHDAAWHQSASRSYTSERLMRLEHRLWNCRAFG